MGARVFPAYRVVWRILEGRFCGLRTLQLVVAIAAVDGPIATRDEGDLSHLVAGCALSGVHLARRLAAEAGEVAILYVAVVLLKGALRRTACRSARRATGRLIHEPLVCVELLLTTREDERLAAISADNLLVRKGQGVGCS